MFDVPDAKRIRRSELHSPRSTPSATRSPSPTTNAQLQARLASLYGLETENPTSTIAILPATAQSQPKSTSERAPEPDQGPNQDAAEEEDEGFEFRLFAAPKASKPTAATPTTTTAATAQPKATSTSASTARIRISSPSPGTADGSGGLVNPHRPQSYYFTFSPTTDGDNKKKNDKAAQRLRAHHFAQSAVSGASILQEARRQPQKPWPGCTLPWRVRVLSRAQHRVSEGDLAGLGGSGAGVGVKGDGKEGNVKGRSKTKPGKKRRIVLRQRAAKKREEAEKRKAGDEEKEREEREKRTRRNREKKVKRKEREKAKKFEGTGGADEGMQVDDVTAV